MAPTSSTPRFALRSRGFCAECGIPREPGVDRCRLCGWVYPEEPASGRPTAPGSPGHGPTRRRRYVVMSVLLGIALLIVLTAIAVEIAATV